MNITNPEADRVRAHMPSADHCLVLLLTAVQTGTLKGLLAPIAEASVSEWLAGFLAAAELESQFLGAFRGADFEASQEWRSLQGPRSIGFGQGAYDFRRARLTSLRSLSSDSTHFPYATPVVGLDAATIGDGPGAVKASGPGRQA